MCARGPQLAVSADGSTTIPASTVISGCGFLTGESTTGASATATVLLEELLDQSVPCLIVDVEQRCYGLKDQYELLHLGDTEHCDAAVTADDAATIAELLIDEEVSVILEVGGFTDGQAARELVADVIDALFDLRNDSNASCVIFVQDFHEFLPGLGGLDEAGEQVQRVANSGLEHGLGLCGHSDQPTVVDEDYLTDCDWRCWHQLTDEHDVALAESILGADAAAEIDELDTDEAVLQLAGSQTSKRVRIRPQQTPEVVPSSLLDDETESEVDFTPVPREYLTALGVPPEEIQPARTAETASGAPAEAAADAAEQVASTSQTTRLYRGSEETTAETIVESRASPKTDEQVDESEDEPVEAAMVVDEPAQEIRPSRERSEDRWSAPMGPPRADATEHSDEEQYHPIWEAGYFLLFCISTVVGWIRRLVDAIERVIRWVTRTPPRARVVGTSGRLTWPRVVAYLCLLGLLGGLVAAFILA
jgi:hypothetical protein